MESENKLSPCLICCKSSTTCSEPMVEFMFGDSSIGQDSGFESCPQSEAQLTVLFVLRKLLKLPENACQGLVSSHGNPSEWGTVFCLQCTGIIEEAQDVSSKIAHFLQKLECLQLKIQEEFQASYGSSREEENAQDDGSKSNIRLEIRKMCVDVVTRASMTEKRKSESNISSEVNLPELVSIPHLGCTDNSIPPVVKVESDEYTDINCNSPIFSHQDDHFGSFDYDDYVDPGSLVQVVSEINYESEEPVSTRRQTRNTSKAKRAELSIKVESRASGRSISSGEIKTDPKTKKDTVVLSGKYKCPLCPKKFPSVNFLNLHYKKIHLGITSAKDKTRSVLKKNQTQVQSSLNARRRERKYRFKCSKCIQYFPSEYFRDAHHKRKHLGVEKPFQCDKCGKAYDRNQSLTLHKKNCSEDGNFSFPAEPKLQESEKFKCPQCFRSFTSEVKRVAHIKKYHEGVDKPFSCHICDKTFSRHHGLADHLKNLHRFIQSDAGKEEDEENDFVDRNELGDDDWVPSPEDDIKSDSDYGDESNSFDKDLHPNKESKAPKTSKRKRVKSTPVPAKRRRVRRSSGCAKSNKPKRERHACTHEECGKRFLSEVLRDGHFKMKHEGIEKPYICDQEGCEKSYRKYFSLQIHKDSQHGKNDQTFICEWCGKSFYNPVAFKRHVYAVHEHKKKIQHKTHPCDQCGKFFKGPSGLKRHIESHKDQPAKKCEVCEAEFPTKLQLYFHRRTQHLIIDPNPNNPTTCPKCGKMFRGQYSLRRHEKLVHQQEFKFTCTICNTGFVDKSSYERHMLTHSGEKPFTCDVCGKGLTRRGDLNRHMRLHTGEKPYTCDQCGENFTDGSKLTKHKKKAHGEPKYDCDVCGKKFYTFTQRRLHKMIHDPEHKARIKRSNPVDTAQPQQEPKSKTPRKPRKPRDQSEKKGKGKRGRPPKTRKSSSSLEFDSDNSAQEFRTISPRDLHPGTHHTQQYQLPSSSAYNLSVNHSQQLQLHHSASEIYRTTSGQTEFQNQVSVVTAAPLPHAMGFMSQTYMDPNLYLHQLQHLNPNSNNS